MRRRRPFAALVTGTAAATLVIALVAALVLRPGRAAALELVADVSHHLIAITTGFTGADVLLFGAIEGEGDVVVVVQGPRSPRVVRRKGRLGGIWVNEAEMVFDDVPGFYAVATTRPLDEFIRESERARHEIGPGYIRVVPPEGAGADRVREFRDALVRGLQAEGLYSREAATIAFISKRLFRVDIRFPSTAPTGTYSVATYLIRDGDVVSAEINPLTVSKIGFEAEVFYFANNNSLAFGLLAIAIAVVAGWVAGVAFRKD